MAEIELLSVVALLEDLPEHGLVRGQVGTVVERLAPGVYEVEYCDDNGRTYAMASLKAAQLMRLHHEPVPQVASRLTLPRFATPDQSVISRFLCFSGLNLGCCRTRSGGGVPRRSRAMARTSVEARNLFFFFFFTAVGGRR